MKNIKKFGIFTFIFGMLLTSCGQITDISLKSPNEDGGLEGNQDQDTVEKRGTEELKKFLTEVGKNEFYSYDLTLTISGETSHFINYYTPNAFYELNDVFENSIGYAQDQNEEIFNFRMSEDLQTVYPSLYVYGDVGSFVKMTTLYDASTNTIPQLL